mmetsp:Transcript_10447/g.33195  ORF Transcript_10447/g.33195 Transcript_10447/m.33195 type:complete len:298 (-) Transcript_10447:718-1611(-)
MCHTRPASETATNTTLVATTTTKPGESIKSSPLPVEFVTRGRSGAGTITRGSSEPPPALVMFASTSGGSASLLAFDPGGGGPGGGGGGVGSGASITISSTWNPTSNSPVTAFSSIVVARSANRASCSIATVSFAAGSASSTISTFTFTDPACTPTTRIRLAGIPSSVARFCTRRSPKNSSTVTASFSVSCTLGVCRMSSHGCALSPPPSTNLSRRAWGSCANDPGGSAIVGVRPSDSIRCPSKNTSNSIGSWMNSDTSAFSSGYGELKCHRIRFGCVANSSTSWSRPTPSTNGYDAK